MRVVGLDEAGRGCWAGPLVAAAVILDKPISGLNDSKLLSRQTREKLALIIKDQAVAFGVGWAAPEEIDIHGLTKATSLAMGRAIESLSGAYDEVIIDGNINYLPEIKNVSTMIKADSLVPAVSAASILAKTERDNYMNQIAKRYPLYQFEKHVGYGTALHKALLMKHGASDIHRMSYKPLQALRAV